MFAIAGGIILGVVGLLLLFKVLGVLAVIAAPLTPEQQARYDQLTAQEREAGET